MKYQITEKLKIYFGSLNLSKIVKIYSDFVCVPTGLDVTNELSRKSQKADQLLANI